MRGWAGSASWRRSCGGRSRDPGSTWPPRDSGPAHQRQAAAGAGLRTYYHGIAGQSLDRLSALSDGVFAVAITLLVQDLQQTQHVSIAFIVLLQLNSAIAPRIWPLNRF